MYNINNHIINIIEIILILENRSRLAYYNERIDLLQQMFLSMQEVFSQNYLKNFINSLQNLRNQLINESTQENDVATIKTIQVIKTNGRPRYEISKDLKVSLAEHHFT
jgi:hypothetical protein